MKKIVLASNSPRRKELMKLLGFDFKIEIPDVEEILNPKMEHDDQVIDLAFQKAYAVFQNHKEDIVIGFDTLVVIDDFVLGKPKDEDEAKLFLNLLSDRTHRVLTGCSILTKGFSRSFHSDADVTFYKLTDSEIEEYIKTREPMDKAGAYGIQGYGSKFVKRVNGDYYTIVGFPIGRLYQELKKLLQE